MQQTLLWQTVILLVIFVDTLSSESAEEIDISCADDDTDCLEAEEYENQTEPSNKKTKIKKGNGKLGDEFLESFLDEDGDIIGLDYRTWRIDRKLLFPILVAIAFKGLALIPVALGKLTVIGSLAIIAAKLSLLLSAIMMLRKFLSGDKTGGFFSLDPLGFHGTNVHRKTLHIG